MRHLFSAPIHLSKILLLYLAAQFYVSWKLLIDSCWNSTILLKHHGRLPGWEWKRSRVAKCRCGRLPRLRELPSKSRNGTFARGWHRSAGAECCFGRQSEPGLYKEVHHGPTGIFPVRPTVLFKRWDHHDRYVICILFLLQYSVYSLRLLLWLSNLHGIYVLILTILPVYFILFY